MVVVVLVGILATVGIMLFRRQVFGSRSVEAMSMMQSIRASQERWRSETGGYLDVSSTMSAWYPVDMPGRTLRNFYDGTAHADFPKWRLLNPTVSGSVQFVYVTKAGPPLTQIPDPVTQDKPPFPAAAQQNEPWYIIEAMGDLNGDATTGCAPGLCGYYVATSLNPEVYSEGDGE